MLLFTPGPGPITGTGPVGIVVSIIDFILRLFGIGQPNIDALVKAINGTYANLVQTGWFLYNAVGFLTEFVRKLVRTIAGAIAHVITDILHGRLYKLLQEILALLHKLHDLVAPLIAVLKRLQQIQRQLQMQYLRKIVDLIQRARRVLVVFRLLHIGWARKLDAYLAGYESDLARKWLHLVRHINAVTGVLDLVLDPRGLLRPGHALGSIGAAIGAVQGAIGALGFRSLLCLPADAPALPIVEPWSVTVARVTMEMRTGTGDYAVFRAQRDQALRQYAIDLGVTSLV